MMREKRNNPRHAELVKCIPVFMEKSTYFHGQVFRTHRYAPVIRVEEFAPRWLRGTV